MDIYLLKTKLREEMRKRRNTLSDEEKSRLSRKITARLLTLEEYKRAEVLFTYVSLKDEAGTAELIDTAISCGKRVAVPRCVAGKPIINFYYINGRDELTRGSYGLLEPPDDHRRLCRYSRGLCVLPGLTFDREGFRLGYGKGYYDRFLQGYRGVKAGLCFSPMISETLLPRGKFDISADFVITDMEIIKTKLAGAL